MRMVVVDMGRAEIFKLVFTVRNSLGMLVDGYWQ